MCGFPRGDPTHTWSPPPSAVVTSVVERERERGAGRFSSPDLQQHSLQCYESYARLTIVVVGMSINNINNIIINMSWWSKRSSRCWYYEAEATPCFSNLKPVVVQSVILQCITTQVLSRSQRPQNLQPSTLHFGEFAARLLCCCRRQGAGSSKSQSAARVLLVRDACRLDLT